VLDVLRSIGDDAKGAIEAIKLLTGKKIKSKYVERIVGHLTELYK